MPNCLAVQHVAPEPAFAIADALVGAGVDIDTRQVFDGDRIPRDSSGFDGLVIMGPDVRGVRPGLSDPGRGDRAHRRRGRP